MINAQKHFYIAVFLLILSCVTLIYSCICFRYELALNYIDNKEYIAAKQTLSSMSFYRDSKQFALYADHAQQYLDEGEDYKGGFQPDVLMYEIEYSPEIDAMISISKSAENRIAEKKRDAKRQALVDKYAGELPQDGMEYINLEYTSLGMPHAEKINKGFRTYVTYYWYKGTGANKTVLAECKTSYGLERSIHDEIFSFHYYG